MTRVDQSFVAAMPQPVVPDSEVLGLLLPEEFVDVISRNSYREDLRQIRAGYLLSRVGVDEGLSPDRQGEWAYLLGAIQNPHLRNNEEKLNQFIELAAVNALTSSVKYNLDYTEAQVSVLTKELLRTHKSLNEQMKNNPRAGSSKLSNWGEVTYYLTETKYEVPFAVMAFQKHLPLPLAEQLMRLPYRTVHYQLAQNLNIPDDLRVLAAFAFENEPAYGQL